MAIAQLLRKGNPYLNVVANGTATNVLTPGRTLDAFRLKLGGTALTKAMLTSIKLKMNGKAVVDVTGTQLDKINTYNGLPVDAGYLDLNFSDPTMLSAFDRNVSGLDSSDGTIASFTTEVVIAGATAPVLEPILLESAAQKDRSGVAAPFAPFFTKLLTFPFAVSAGGKMLFPHIPAGAGNGCIVKRVYIFHGGYMTGAVVKEDGVPVHESLRLENEYHQKRYGKVPQANVYVIDFAVTGEIGDALNTRLSRTLEWLFEFSQADSGTIIVEALDTLPNN